MDKNAFRVYADGSHLTIFNSLAHKFMLPWQTDYIEVYGYEHEEEILLAVFRISITEEFHDFWCRPEGAHYQVRLQLNGEPYEEKDINACIHILFHH